MGERKDAYRLLWGSLMERDYLQDLVVDGRIMELDLKK
jgi:hypothetical protein